MNKQQAESYVMSVLNCITNTKVVISHCNDYDFGWYFGYKVIGEHLCGGPDYGILIHKDGYTYPLHYVGTAWDTGIGTHMSEDVVKEINGILQPTKTSIRYFLKQCSIKNQIKDGIISINKTFKTSNGYDVESAIKYLKLELCIPHEEAFKWIQQDSGINICNYGSDGYNPKYTDVVHHEYCKAINEGLYDSNWVEYYNRKIT
jgi:hypothetical protein